MNGLFVRRAVEMYNALRLINVKKNEGKERSTFNFFQKRKK